MKALSVYNLQMVLLLRALNTWLLFCKQIMAPLLTERGLFVEGKTNHICCKLRKNQIQGKVASQILNSLHQVMLIKICCLCVRSTVFRDAKYHNISLIFYIYTAQKLRRKYLREFLRLLYRKRHHAVDLHD